MFKFFKYCTEQNLYDAEHLRLTFPLMSLSGAAALFLLGIVIGIIAFKRLRASKQALRYNSYIYIYIYIRVYIYISVNITKSIGLFNLADTNIATCSRVYDAINF